MSQRLRDARYQAPPVQIRTREITSYGSYLGSYLGYITRRLWLLHVSCPIRSMLPPVPAYSSQSFFQDSPCSPAFPPTPPPLVRPILFGFFFGTMPMSDSSGACTPGLWTQTFPDRPVTSLRVPPRSPGSRTWSVRTCHGSTTPRGQCKARCLVAFALYCLPPR